MLAGTRTLRSGGSGRRRRTYVACRRYATNSYLFGDAAVLRPGGAAGPGSRAAADGGAGRRAAGARASCSPGRSTSVSAAVRQMRSTGLSRDPCAGRARRCPTMRWFGCTGSTRGQDRLVLPELQSQEEALAATRARRYQPGDAGLSGSPAEPAVRPGADAGGRALPGRHPVRHREADLRFMDAACTRPVLPMGETEVVLPGGGGRTSAGAGHGDPPAGCLVRRRRGRRLPPRGGGLPAAPREEYLPPTQPSPATGAGSPRWRVAGRPARL